MNNNNEIISKLENEVDLARNDKSKYNLSTANLSLMLAKLIEDYSVFFDEKETEKLVNKNFNVDKARARNVDSLLNAMTLNTINKDDISNKSPKRSIKFNMIKNLNKKAHNNILVCFLSIKMI